MLQPAQAPQAAKPEAPLVLQPGRAPQPEAAKPEAPLALQPATGAGRQEPQAAQLLAAPLEGRQACQAAAAAEALLP